MVLRRSSKRRRSLYHATSFYGYTEPFGEGVGRGGIDIQATQKRVGYVNVSGPLAITGSMTRFNSKQYQSCIES